MYDHIIRTKNPFAMSQPGMSPETTSTPFCKRWYGFFERARHFTYALWTGKIYRWPPTNPDAPAMKIISDV
jgi:hypothetical protein